MKTFLRISFLAIIAFALFGTVRANADTPGPHPAYLHALSDLRFARANLERRGGDPQVKWDEKSAIGAIDRAIGDIKQASIDDGKNLDDHPPVDANLNRWGRLHRALEALEKCRKDIHEKEDNNYAKGLRDRALANIDAAIDATKDGLASAQQ